MGKHCTHARRSNACYRLRCSQSVTATCHVRLSFLLISCLWSASAFPYAYALRRSGAGTSACTPHNTLCARQTHPGHRTSTRCNPWHAAPQWGPRLHSRLAPAPSIYCGGKRFSGTTGSVRYRSTPVRSVHQLLACSRSFKNLRCKS